MNFTDCLLLTFANVAICISLPKLLSMIQAPKNNPLDQFKPELITQVAESKTPSFDY